MKRILQIAALACVTQALLLPGSWGEVAGPTAEIRGLLEEWRAEQALKAAEKRSSVATNDPETLGLVAESLFSLGRYKESLDWYDKALALETQKDEGRLGMRLLVQQTVDVVGAYRSYTSRHFELFLDPDADSILAEYALETLERAHDAVQQKLGFSPSGRVRVEIFPDSRSFNAVSTLSLRDIEVTGAVGLCKFNKIMLLSPRALVRGFRWLDSLSHEYLHYAIVFLTKNKAPIWLHEGLARHEEAGWRGPDSRYLNAATETLLAHALNTGRFVGFKKMDPSLVNLDSPEEVELAYAEAASAIEFMIVKKGFAGLRSFLKAVGETGTEKAVQTVFGLDFAEFEREWKGFLREKGLREFEGVRVRRYKVKNPQKPVDEETVELAEIQSLVARNRTRLGDRLLARGMLKAAQLEYRRARNASPNSALILNKLGRTELQLHRYDDAARSFHDALQVDPDYGSAYVNLGRLYLQTENLPSAKEAFLEAISINPFNPSVHALLGKIYRSLGEEAKAEKEERVVRVLAKGKG